MLGIHQRDRFDETSPVLIIVAAASITIAMVTVTTRRLEILNIHGIAALVTVLYNDGVRPTRPCLCRPPRSIQHGRPPDPWLVLKMTKIWRTADDPVLTGSKLRGKVQQFSVPGSEDMLDLLYKRAAWHFVCSDIRGVKQRHTIGRILSGGLPAGSFRVVETRIPPFTDADDFFDEMDSYSITTARLAETLNAHWQEPHEFAAYGDVVEIDRLWMDPRYSKNDRLRRSMSVLLDRLYPDRSLLILKAFPLEYEGEACELNAAAFEHRLRAMKRHYARCLGVVPFLSESGRDGWMYAIPDRLIGIMPSPRESV